jgi:hypothetical protein
MATSLISPGVEVREIDLTTIVPSVSTTEGAIAGVFRWGPVEERVLIDSEVELVNRFGKPTNLNAETFFTAASFLTYGNRLYSVRVANTVGSSPSATVNTDTTSTTVTLSTGDTANLSAGMVVINSAGGGVANGATIASIVNSTAFTVSALSEIVANTTTDAVQFISNTAFTAVSNTAGVANLESQIVKNEEHFTQKDGTFDTDVKWVARFPGDIGNSLRVSVCGNSTGYSSAINLASFATRAYFAVNTNANTANVSLVSAANADNSANATAIRALMQITDLVEVGNTLLGVQYMKVTAFSNTVTYGTTGSNVTITTVAGNTTVIANNTTGMAAGMEISAGNNDVVGKVLTSVVNSTAFIVDVAPTVALTTDETTVDPRATFAIQFEDPFKLAEDYLYTTANTTLQSFNRHWEFFNLIDTAPGQSDYQIQFGNSSINSDEMHIVVTDNGGKFTGVPGNILEVYRNVSRATDSKNLDGGANYYRTVVNDGSQYVYAVNDMSGGVSNTALNLGDSTLDVTVNDFNYGNDGQDESNISIGAITNGYLLFENPEDVDVALVMQGKARGFTLANWLIDNLCEKRIDCIALISPQKGDVVNNIGNEVAAAISFRNNLRSSSYGVMDSGYKYMYDKYNDIYRWIPLNGDTAGLCVNTDKTTEPWYSPAGLNRGHIKNIVKLAYNPRQAQRDDLYKAGINPVVTFPGQGTILYGDKTLLAKPSAFDRINVRRLFIVLEKAISRASKFVLFEFNDEFTRLQFRNLVVPYLRDVQGRRGIFDFEVVCDTTNNTPEVIDRNEFIGDIYIKPARSINFIQLNFIAVRTGVNFDEIIGRF